MILIINVHELIDDKICTRKLEVEADPKDRIEVVKSLICIKDPGLVSHRCYLLHGGRLLEDERRCRHYDIISFSQLHMVRRHSRGSLFEKEKRTPKGTLKGTGRRRERKAPKAQKAQKGKRSFKEVAVGWVKDGGRFLNALVEL